MMRVVAGAIAKRQSPDPVVAEKMRCAPVRSVGSFLSCAQIGPTLAGFPESVNGWRHVLPLTYGVIRSGPRRKRTGHADLSAQTPPAGHGPFLPGRTSYQEAAMHRKAELIDEA